MIVLQVIGLIALFLVVMLIKGYMKEQASKIKKEDK